MLPVTSGSRKESPSPLRKFALKLAFIPLVPLAVLLWGKWATYGIIAAAWIGLLSVFLIVPGPLAPVRNGLRTLGRIVGGWTTRGLLFFAYFFVLVPTGLLAKLVGKKFLAMSRDKEAKSYWTRPEKRRTEKADWLKPY